MSNSLKTFKIGMVMGHLQKLSLNSALDSSKR